MMVDMAQYQLLQLSQEYQDYLLMTGYQEYQEYLYQEYYQQEYLAMQQYLHQLQALYAAPPPSPPSPPSPSSPAVTHAHHQEAPLDLSRTKAKTKASSGCRCPVCGKIFTRAWLLKGGSRTRAANEPSAKFSSRRRPLLGSSPG